MKLGVLKTLFIQIVVSLSQFSIPTAMAAESNAKVKIAPGSHEIAGLSWNSSLNVEHDGVLQLHGIFNRKGWNLVYLEKSLTKDISNTNSSERTFTIEVTASGPQTPFTLKAIGPHGLIEECQYLVRFQNVKYVQDKSQKANSFTLIAFQLEPVLLLQSGNYLATGEVSWIPRFTGHNWFAEIHVGWMPFKTTTSNTLFSSVEYAAALAVKVFKPIWLEGLGGMQYWSDAGSNNPVVGGFLLIRMSTQLFHVIDQFHIGYTDYLAPTPISQLRVGVGISF